MITMETIYESDYLEVIKSANETRAIYTLCDKSSGEVVTIYGFDMVALVREVLEEIESK